MDQHTLVLAHGIIAFLNVLADPVHEGRPNDGGTNIADPWLGNFQQFLTIGQVGQDVRKLLEERVDDLEAQVLVRWDLDLLDGIHGND